MPAIAGMELNLTHDELLEEIRRGARFVVYRYCISFIFVTSRGESSVYFRRPGQAPPVRAVLLTLMTLIVGWWGFPWGPIYTIGSFITNLSGGKNVTDDVLQQIQQPVTA